jgi:hypothetical protein
VRHTAALSVQSLLVCDVSHPETCRSLYHPVFSLSRRSVDAAVTARRIVLLRTAIVKALCVSLIDLPAMTQCQYQYHQAVVLNVADGSIINDAVTP